MDHVAYERRTERLQRLLELRAPPSIIYSECRLVLKTATPSAYRVIVSWAWDETVWLLRGWYQELEVRWVAWRKGMTHQQAAAWLADREEERGL